MLTSTKSLFLSYLSQLNVIVEKIPDSVFSETLHTEMFSLETNAQIAANFLLRGYCPLIEEEIVSIELSESGKLATLELIQQVKTQLELQDDFNGYDDRKLIVDKAGFNDISLPQSQFILSYIIPNFMFHMSMVYAIARKNSVDLSKGDFDGLHTYPTGFSFVE